MTLKRDIANTTREQPPLPDRDVSPAPLLYPSAVKVPDKPLGFVRWLRDFVRNPLRALPISVYQQPGVVFERAHFRMLWLTDPKLTEDVLLTRSDTFPKTPIDRRILAPTLGAGMLSADGAHWKWQRKTAAPMFRHREVMGYVPAFVAAADEQIDRWRAAGDGRRAVDADMVDTTFSVITRTILKDCDPETGRIIAKSSESYLEPISWEVAWGMLGLPTWVWHPARRRMTRDARAMREAVGAYIDQRTTLTSDHHAEDADPAPDDILSRLIRTRSDAGDAAMTRDQIIDNLATFFTAGHETTSRALTWTLYLLARSPEWQARVFREVQRVTGGKPIDASHLEALEDTELVLLEAMRLYPPAPVITRIAAEDADIGPFRVNRGNIIIIPIYAVHRHQAHWQNPDAFLPERFANGGASQFPRTQYMPFGFGPRTCIGATFAIAEAKALLATLVSAAEFRWDGTHDPEPTARVTLWPDGGMPLEVTLR